jgi:DNA repair protein RadC
MQELSIASNGDLFALVLGRRTAQRLSSLPSLRELRTTGVSELTGGYGLSDAAAVKVSALVELVRRIDGDRLVRSTPLSGSASVFRHAVALGLPDLQVEQFRLLILDGKHRLIDDVLVSQGTLTSSPVHPREVFHPAIRAKAAVVVLLHNHPSGDPSPSADDLEITRRLVQVGDLLGIRVVDHVIVGQGAFCSMADRGLLS